MPDYCHLHNHSQYSLLDGASEIGPMMDKAKADGQKGVALTDHGNMFGAFKFVAEAKKRDLKPIVGCEFYLVKDRHKRSFMKSKGERDKRYHQLMLAKNRKGYENLMKLCSLGFIEGAYGKFPRIDKELVLKYHEGIIVTSCCLGAEIPQAILNGKLEEAAELTKWWKDLFGEDFYIELQRHRGLENIDGTGVSQEDINQELIKLATKFDVKMIATNDSHYLEEDDWKPHDILLCVNTGQNLSAEKRFRFPSSDFYFKTQDEMGALFKDVPQALDFTMEVFDKVDNLTLARDILLPNFPLPTGFVNQSEYLKHLVYEGAKWRYPQMTDDIRKRLDYELDIIRKMGFDGYFLIVQDFIKAAREINVSVGPGRGSAAGSAVAYCLTITNIDPIEYKLLFERFLNPERISMPDIDIDFDDEGRQKVIDWVVDKYGKEQVAQIITFGTMAARSSIRDVARVTELPLNDADRLAKLVPARPGTKLKHVFADMKSVKSNFNGDDVTNIATLQQIQATSSHESDTLTMARKLEGSIRNSGIHAAGLIIAPDDITKYIPVSTSKESNLYITQFDGSVVEDAGMLKMDFLGLKTLSIIKDAISNIVLRHGEEARIDPDEIPTDDKKTFELFQKGEMIGVFQFESEGMRKSLKELKPTTMEDLIAMNALYRPGPMDFIPTFIKRKHGQEKTEYPHEWLEELLEPTYGIMVYQEQIMRAAQIMADFTLGAADILRRAMGKKKHAEMARQSKIFVEGAVKKGVDEKQAQEIFDVMAKFASYGFNRSHAAAYSVVAFQTAYLKAHYPAEYMAAVLTHNKSDTTKLNFFLRECKHMKIDVLGPDINESNINFTVNQSGQIRFGLSALKGVGEGPVEEILKDREENGSFKSIFDMTTRLNSRLVNKRCYESLVLGGGFDTFGDIHRAQYFAPSDDFDTLISHAIKFGGQVQRIKNENQTSLFGEVSDSEISYPDFPNAAEWPLIHKLTKEKEITGIYISGHPLDDFQLIIDNFITCSIADIEKFKDRDVVLSGIVTKVNDRINKKGMGFGIYAVEDFYDNLELALFKEDYLKFKNMFRLSEAIYLKGRFEKRWGKYDYAFSVKDVGLLESLGEKHTESITIFIDNDKLNEELITQLDDICKSHEGPHKLKYIIFDKEEEVKVNMVSMNRQVMAKEELLEAIKNMDLKVKIN